MSLQIKSFHYLAEKRIHRQLSTPEEAWKLYDGLIKIHSIKSMIALKGTHRVTDNALSISPLTLLPPSETSTMMLPASEGPEGTVIQHQEDLVDNQLVVGKVESEKICTPDDVGKEVGLKR